MAQPISEAAKRAVKLLKKKHPEHRWRNYTITEAAAIEGVSRSTIYRHLGESKQGEKQ